MTNAERFELLDIIRMLKNDISSCELLEAQRKLMVLEKNILKDGMREGIRKFDKVRVRKAEDLEEEEKDKLLGAEAVVIKIDDEDNFPFEVEFLNNEVQSLNVKLGKLRFKKDELEVM